MSTDKQQIESEIPSRGLISTNTIANSLRKETKNARLEPEDLRTNRFGYNPAYLLTMDPIHTGLQTELIEPGLLIPFESIPVKRQNLSVDKDDRTPPDRWGELLAGEAFANIYTQYAGKGWRELLPLRGMGNGEAEELFYRVHPPLAECVEASIIPRCIYELDVCVTCRLDFLNAVNTARPDKDPSSLFSIVREANTVARAVMASDWAIWTGEIAQSQGTNNSRMAIRQLSDGHLFFMRQLHERTPADQELAKIAANAKAQADVMQKALGGLAATMTASRSAENDAAVIAAQGERLRLLEEQMERMSATATDPEAPTS